MAKQKLLLVEDNAADARLVRESFYGLGDADFDITHVERLTEALTLLELTKPPFDAVLLDLSLPDEQGLSTLSRVTAAVPDVPVVIMTGLNDQETALKAVHQGAQDYLVKGEADISALPRAVRYAIERHKIEHALREARRSAEEAMHLKDKFVSLVAHDLQAPLISIITMLKIVTMDTEKPLGSPQAEVLGRVRETAEGMSTMIEELLNISRLQTGSIIPQARFIDGSFVTMSVIDRLSFAAVKKGVSLVNSVPHGSRLYCDLNLMSEVLYNVISNAVKFSKPGGTVEVFVPKGKSSAIAIRDHGVGMDEEALSKLFKHDEHFSTPGTAGERGTGLGMPLSFDIMKAHGGAITAISRKGEGSTFTLSLPEVKPVILIVDDDYLLRLMFKEQLANKDMEILEASNGKEALTMIDQRLPHLMVIDLMMPVMDGLELLEILRKNPRTRLIPSIVITSSPDMEMRERAFHLGADDFIAKPFVIEELLPRIHRFIV